MNDSIKQQEQFKLSDPDVGEPRDDVEQHPPMTLKRIMALLSLACLVSAAQIPLYLIGGTLGNGRLRTRLLIHLAFIVADIGGETSFAWLGIANTIAYAATAPFAGATSDLIGRRYVALAGAALNVIGMVVIGTAHRIDVAIGGMAIAGVGSGFAEVIGTAGITELAPVKSRGLYIGMAYTLILPAAASSGYGISYEA